MRAVLSVAILFALAAIVSARTSPMRSSHGTHAATPAPLQTSNVTWSIMGNSPLISVSPSLYGIFFEEINHAGVGGLYAEQINNANFETTDTSDFNPWTIGTMSSGTTLSLFLNQDMPLNAYNPTNLQATTTAQQAGGTVEFTNPGFWGINTKGVSSFMASVWVYSSTVMSITLSVQSTSGKVYGSCMINGITSSWSKKTCTINVSGNDTMAVFAVSFMTTGMRDAINFDVFSLLPSDGWMGLPYIRAELGNYIAAMKPAFVRFPGGCYVEGDLLKDRFDWRRSLGPQENRRGHFDLWGYYSEDGLGMFEYLSFVEKLRDSYGNPTQVVWVVNSGTAHSDSIPTADVQGWVQDALDSLEFATGASTTRFGAIRASMGHADPFKISHLAIGNEDCGKPYYDTNYLAFYNAITKAYPNIITIANCQNPGRGLPVQSWDYHMYNTAEWFYDNQKTFDSYDRSSGIKIFNSEYAVTTGSGTRGNLGAALGEAHWMNGLERNSDIVTMASYAPLLVNDNDRHWSPDAIVFNSGQVFGTPSYWNQVLYSSSIAGTMSGSVKTLSYKTDTSMCSSCKLSFAIATGMLSMSEAARIGATTVYIHKLVNSGNAPVTVSVSLAGISGTPVQTADVAYITGRALTDENDFQNPTRISLMTTTMMISSNMFTINLPALSVYSVRVYV